MDAASPRLPRTPAAQGATPAMAQWFAIKEEHPDALLFFRMGDFYELFFADAEAAAAALDIALTAARRARRRAHPDVRRAGPRVRGLSRAADPPRLPRRRRRADGEPQGAHRQGPDPARGGAPRHARDHHRGRAARGRPRRTCCWRWRRSATRSAPPGSTSPPACSRPAAPPRAELSALLGRLDPAEILAPRDLNLADWSGRRAPERPPPPPLIAPPARRRGVRRGQPRGLRQLLRCRGRGGRLGARLCARDPGGRAAAPLPPDAAGSRGRAGDGRGDAGEPRDPARRAMAAAPTRCSPPCSAP